MNQLNFIEEEVIAYLEDKILMNMATEDEEVFYQDYKWDDSLNKNNYTYKKLVKQMRRLYEIKF